MKIALQFETLQGLADWNQAKGFVRQVFEDLTAQIQTGWNRNHNADGSHGDVSARSVTSTNGFTEYGRTLKVGEWEDVRVSNLDASSDSGTFTIGANPINIKAFRYTKIGKTIFLSIRFFNSSTVITGSPEYLRIKLPPHLAMVRLSDAFADDDRVFCGVAETNQGAAFCFVGIRPDGFTYLEFEPAPSGTWSADASFTIAGQLFYEGANY